MSKIGFISLVVLLLWPAAGRSSPSNTVAFSQNRFHNVARRSRALTNLQYCSALDNYYDWFTQVLDPTEGDEANFDTCQKNLVTALKFGASALDAMENFAKGVLPRGQAHKLRRRIENGQLDQVAEIWLDILDLLEQIQFERGYIIPT